MSTVCVLCGTADTTPYAVSPQEVEVPLCATCLSGVTGVVADALHWRCLNDAVWSGDHGAQVVAWRLLHKIDAAWARDLLEIVYLEPEVQAWAEAGPALGEQPADIIHRDSNGSVLVQGDNVHLIKDLPVKGAGFTAKRGTVVRGISLVADNADQIEGRVDGQRIVILTAFVKKS